MSTVSTTQNCQTPAKSPERMPSELAKPKLTAANIEANCPVRLQEIGREITEKLQEAREQTRRADDHVIAINKLIAEARELCDVGGYDKFRELFCPQLGKSQAYVRLAIAAGKTTVVEHRAKERARKQKTRANQKAAAANSGTVPENSEPQDPPTDAAAVQATSVATDHTPEPKKPWSATASDEGLCVFAAHLMGLYKGTNKRPPEHFSATTIPVEIIAQLASFLTALTILKKSDVAEPTPIVALPDNGTASVGQPAVKAEHAALEASVDMVA